MVDDTHYPRCFKGFLGSSGLVLDQTVVISTNNGASVTEITNTLSFVTLRNPSDKKRVNRMMNEMRQLMAD